MAEGRFDYLTGTVEVPAAAPEEWAAEGLESFYIAPNDERWGRVLCRVLYHESIHFWQLLSSAYLANLVSADWRRLLHLEETGELPPRDPAVTAYGDRGNHPFSPEELVECWARYWDVHTRGPAAIVADEGLDPAAVELMQVRDPYTGNTSYTGAAYDFLMQGADPASAYAAPYRWMLEQTQGHSPFVAIAFPVLAHAAFGSPQPVAVFHGAFERAWNSPLLRAAVEGRSGNVNLDWLNNWGAFLGEAVQPELAERGLPSFTSGFDVIHRGSLGSHPVYMEYLERGRVLIGHVRLNKLFRAAGDVPDDPSRVYDYAINDLPSRDWYAISGLPGQPTYRLMLGVITPPPRVRFDNIEVPAAAPPRPWAKASPGRTPRSTRSTRPGWTTSRHEWPGCDATRRPRSSVSRSTPSSPFRRGSHAPRCER